MQYQGSKEEDEEIIHHHQFKVILLGDGTVGKTSISKRLIENVFNENYHQTIGVDFFNHSLLLDGKCSYIYILSNLIIPILYVSNAQIFVDICIFSNSCFCLLHDSKQITIKLRYKCGTLVDRV